MPSGSVELGFRSQDMLALPVTFIWTSLEKDAPSPQSGTGHVREASLPLPRLSNNQSDPVHCEVRVDPVLHSSSVSFPGQAKPLKSLIEGN